MLSCVGFTMPAESLLRWNRPEVKRHTLFVFRRNRDADGLKVQLWKYNPSYFAKEGCVDLVSLVCTFRGNEDERIEMSIEKLLEEL